MLALLSGAWWAQKLTGISARAIAIAVCIALAIGSLWWLRYDARRDEAYGWTVRLVNARAQDLTKLRLRERQSEAISAQAAQGWAAQLAAAERARAELEAKLAAMKANPVCWPRSLVGDLNR